MGAIYVRPEFRGRGLATKAIKDFMLDRRGRAFIEHENIASQRAYEKAGFSRQSPETDDGSWWEKS